MDGDFAEFGIALGGSSICIASALDGKRSFFGFDVFEQIPPPSERDGPNASARYSQIVSGESSGINGSEYYGYLDDIYGRVCDNFRKAGFIVDNKAVRLIRGLFQDTLSSSDLEVISLAHIDCDWYDPVLECLNFIWPKLSVGGVIILDDYNDWDGCRQATDDFLNKTPDATLYASKPHAIIFRSMS